MGPTERKGCCYAFPLPFPKWWKNRIFLAPSIGDGASECTVTCIIPVGAPPWRPQQHLGLWVQAILCGWTSPTHVQRHTDTALTHYDFSSCSCNSFGWSYSGMQGVCCYLRSCKLGESPCASQIYSLLTLMYVNRFWPQGLDVVKIFLPAWCRLDK